MEAIRALFFYHLAREFPDEMAAFCDEAGDRVSVKISASRDEFLRELPSAHVVVAAPMSEADVARAANLRLHVIPFAGVNRVPIQVYRERGIRLANSHGNAPAVAERAMALALAASGRVVEFDGALRAGRWHRRNDDVHPFHYWRSLRDARVTVLGGGAIARETARLLRPLAGTITAFRRTPQQDARCFDAETDDLDAALNGCDLVVAALPLTDQTRSILTAERLHRTNRAVFVNVSRAEIVDEAVLFGALREGILAAAGLDVWYRYPDPFWSDQLPSDLAFHELSNVVLSPHAGSHCDGGKRGQLVGALAAVRAFANDEPISTEVPLDRGY